MKKVNIVKAILDELMDPQHNDILRARKFMETIPVVKEAYARIDSGKKKFGEHK